MKIAYIALRGVPLSDGIVQYTDDLARRLVERGHEVTVYTSRRYGNKTGIYDNSYKIVTVPSLPWGFAEKMSIVFFASIHQLFQKYDIVHYHAMGPSVFAFMAKRKHRVVVIQSHGVEYERGKYKKFAKNILKKLEKWSVNMGDELLVCSEALYDHFYKDYGKKTVVIHNAVEIPELVPIDYNKLKTYDVKDGDYYLFMARITPEKGLHYLISAFKKLDTDRKLIIAGPYDKENKYCKELLKMTAGDKRISFVGFASGEDKFNLLRGAYAFVLPSELEGFSVALLEAMSYEKCCIVSDIPSNIEAIGKEGNCGIAFKSKNEHSLYEALCIAESSPELVKQYGISARKRIEENFSEETLVNKTEKLYMDLLQRKREQKERKRK